MTESPSTGQVPSDVLDAIRKSQDMMVEATKRDVGTSLYWLVTSTGATSVGGHFGFGHFHRIATSVPPGPGDRVSGPQVPMPSLPRRAGIVSRHERRPACPFPASRRASSCSDGVGMVNDVTSALATNVDRARRLDGALERDAPAVMPWSPTPTATTCRNGTRRTCPSG